MSINRWVDEENVAYMMQFYATIYKNETMTFLGKIETTL